MLIEILNHWLVQIVILVITGSIAIRYTVPSMVDAIMVRAQARMKTMPKVTMTQAAGALIMSERGQKTFWDYVERKTGGKK